MTNTLTRQTETSEFLKQPIDAYALVAIFSPEAKKVIGELLAKLQKEIGDGLWPMPVDALHITLCEIVEPKPYSQNRQDLFEAHAADYLDKPALAISNIGPVTVNFNKVEASNKAIIIRGEDDGSLNAIRHRLVESMPLPDETKNPPDIIHCSIARFTQNLDFDQIQQIVARHSLDFTEIIKEFLLVNSLVQPLLDYRTMRIYSLIRPAIKAASKDVRLL
jgi:hypothetical protein